MKSIGETEFYTGYTILTSQQIDEFLAPKTGYVLADTNGNFTWDYVSEYDAYIFVHGDTNNVDINVTNGQKMGDNLYEVEYTFDGGFHDINRNEINGGSVTFILDKETLIFVSNNLHE